MKFFRCVCSLASAAVMFCAAACGSTDNLYDAPGDSVGMTTVMETEPEKCDASETREMLAETRFPDSEFELFGWDYDENGAYYCSDVMLSDGKTAVLRDLSGGGIYIDNVRNVISLAMPGLYRFTGALTDGRIISVAEGNVRVILQHAVVNCSSGAPLVFLGGGQKVITAAKDSTNVLGSSLRPDPYEQPFPEYLGSAVYSQGSVTFNGAGKLDIISSGSRGIESAGTVKMMSGSITVVSQGDGITGKNVVVRGGDVVVDTKGGCGIKAPGISDDSGCFAAEGGSLRVTSAFDSVYAERFVCVTGSSAKLNLCSGSGSDSHWYDEIFSRKGIRSDGNVAITGGSVNADCLDVALYSEGEILVSGDTALSLCAKRTAVKCGFLALESGRMEIKKSSCGIEAEQVAVDGGALKIISSGDGMSLAADKARSGRECALFVQGGSADVGAYAAGLNVKGKALIEGGDLFVSGGEDGFSPAVKAEGGLKIDGGKVMMTAPSGAIQTPAEQSEQPAAVVSFRKGVDAGSALALTGESEVLFSRELSADAGSVLFSDPGIKTGGEYAVEVNGARTGSFVQESTFVSVGVA